MQHCIYCAQAVVRMKSMSLSVVKGKQDEFLSQLLLLNSSRMDHKSIRQMVKIKKVEQVQLGHTST